MSDYTSDDSTEIHVRHHHRDRSPFGRRPSAAGGPHYIQTVREVPRAPPTGYYQPAPPYPRAAERTVVIARSRSRERRSPPVRQGPPPPPPPAAPQVVINQPYVNRRPPRRDSDSSSDESSHHRSRHRHRSHSHARSRSSSTHSHIEDARERWRLQQLEEQLNAVRLETSRREGQRQLERYSREQAELAKVRAELEMRQRREEDELHHDRYRDEYELVNLKREIARVRRKEEELKEQHAREHEAQLTKDSNELARLKQQQEERRREEQAKEEAEFQKTKADLERRIRAEEESKRDKAFESEAKAKAALAELERIHKEKKEKEEEERIRREVELKKLEAEKKAEEERKRKEKEAEEVIAAYKAKEAEREAKEKAEKEANEKEFQRRMQEQLINSGLDEKAIEAIMKKEKIKRERRHEVEVEEELTVARPTFTRMALRHLELETLRFYKIDWEPDASDPGYILVRRWVPEWERNMLWEHTKRIRIEHRSGGEEKIMLEVKGDRRHHRHKSGEYEFVRPKRHRSKSPGLLMYLAGGRPS